METRLKHLESQIEEIARSQIYSASVKKLRAFKGIGTLAAMILISEITDFRRFATPRALMAFLGLIPSENSSGDKQRGGSITKAGNCRCRTQLIESMQHYVKSPHISLQMRCDLSQVDALTANRAIKCLKRLHKRYWALTMKGKNRPVAITAIAREFVGFIWAVMQPEPLPA
jgi:transposase